MCVEAVRCVTMMIKEDMLNHCTRVDLPVYGKMGPCVLVVINPWKVCCGACVSGVWHVLGGMW